MKLFILISILWLAVVQNAFAQLRNNAEVIPQLDVRRYLGYGQVAGEYEDAKNKVSLEGVAYDLGIWHKRWNSQITASWGISLFDMEGIQQLNGNETTVQYERTSLNASLGYGFAFGFAQIHPQYMVGYGQGKFSKSTYGSSLTEVYGETTSDVTVNGPELLVHFDLTRHFFVGLKAGYYENSGEVKYSGDTGKVKASTTLLLTLGYRSWRNYGYYDGIIE